jgi:hypothetical protein
LLRFSYFSFFKTMFRPCSQATKYKSSIKKKFEDNFQEGGQRNWLQVFQFQVLFTTSSVSGQLRNWFRPLPFPASCGTGSGPTSVSGQCAELVAVMIKIFRSQLLL